VLGQGDGEEVMEPRSINRVSVRTSICLLYMYIWMWSNYLDSCKNSWHLCSCRLATAQ